MGFELRLNGELLQELDYEPEEVSYISFLTNQGEAGRVGSPAGDGYINIIVGTRDVEESDYLDVVTLRDQRERAERREESSRDKVEEGRAAMRAEEEERNAENDENADENQNGDQTTEETQNGDENQTETGTPTAMTDTGSKTGARKGSARVGKAEQPEEETEESLM